MSRRKKQHPRLAFGAIPRWLYDMLANGEISGPQFVVWAVIRGYVKDEERGTFSPPPIDLTNREIAQGAGISTKRARQLLVELEEAGVLQRLTADKLAAHNLGGNRWLRLIRPHTPPKNKGEINMGEKDMEETNNNSYSSPRSGKTSRDPTSEGTVVIESSSRKGGPGEKVNNPQEIRGEINNPHKNTEEKDKVEKSQGEKRRAVALTLRDLGAFSGPAFDIADQMLADARFNTLTGKQLATEVQDTFYRVYRQSEQDARNEHEVMRFTISRLRNGDWGDRALATQEEARLRRLEQHTQVSYHPEEHSPSEAEKLWNDTLRELELQMTRATFDTWLQGSKGLRINGDGNTLVVQVRNEYALEWLENRLYSLISRTLRYTLTYSDEPELPLDPDQFKITFAVEKNTEEEVS